MLTYTIEVVLGVLLVLVVMQLFKKKKSTASSAPALPQADLANLKVTDAKTGDVLSVAGVGDDMNDLDFTADRTASYQSGQRSWRELSGMYRNRRVSLRV